MKRAKGGKGVAVTREGQGVVVGGLRGWWCCRPERKEMTTEIEEKGRGGGGRGGESRETEVVVDEQGGEEVNQGWKSRVEREREREGRQGVGGWGGLGEEEDGRCSAGLPQPVAP